MKNQKATKTAQSIVNIAKINTVEFIKGRKGQYRAIVKVQAGFLTVADDLGIQANWGKQQWDSAIDVFRSFKKGALQSIQFKPDNVENASWLTVFARSGKTIKLADADLLAEMTVGDINQDWSNTNLYNQNQYNAVNAKNWAHMAFVANAA